VLQRDDEGSPRDSGMKLFDALGSAEKALHANPSGRFRVPAFEIDSSIRFFSHHLDRIPIDAPRGEGQRGVEFRRDGGAAVKGPGGLPVQIGNVYP
jgi:hypothetical protein